jgi:hypothetical protein
VVCGLIFCSNPANENESRRLREKDRIDLQYLLRTEG